MPHGRVRVLQEAIGEGVACEDLTFCRCQDCGKTTKDSSCGVVPV